MNDLLRSSRSPWAATPFIAISTFASLWALTRMIDLGAWMRTTALALVAVMLVVMIVRLASRSRYLPTFLGVLTGVMVLIPLYARDDEGAGFGLPSPAALKALASTIKAGVDYASASTSPAVVDRTLGALLTVGLLGLFLLAEHIAVSWRAVASAGFLLLLPWFPAVILGHRVSTGALVISLGAWVATMALSRRNAPIERGISFGAATTATVATLALASLAVPAALGGVGWGSIPAFNTPHAFDGPNRLNLELDLRSSLTTNSDAPVLVYLTSGPRPDAFRLYTLTDFDGAHINAPDSVPTNRPATAGLLWPEEVPDWNTSERIRLNVNILSGIERNLPLATAPRTVAVDGDWTYDAENDTVVGENVTTRNLNYSMLVDFAFHDPEVLRASDDLLDNDPNLDVSDPQYLEIAPAIDRARVQALAEDITADATTRYDKAVAIQNYLRNPDNFTYSLSVNPSGDDSVSTFLDSREGYCVQFATTMMVMLRSLGIPSRLGLGYLAGSFDEQHNGYVVRGSDAHIWPEIFFANHGWVRFEPTPAIQTGSPPIWTDPNASQVPVPGTLPEEGGLPTNPNGDNSSHLHPIPGSGSGSPAAWWLYGGIAVALAALATVGILVLRRKAGVTSRALHGPEGAWQRLADRLGDLAWPSSATPGEAREHVIRALSMMVGRPPAPAGAEALTSLSGAVSDHRYAPGGTTIPQAQLDTWVTQVVTEAETATAEATGHPVRGASRSAPRDGS